MVTVALIKDHKAQINGLNLPFIDLSGTVETFYRSSGAGGQHRNKTETGVRLQHPSGVIVTCAKQRHKRQNQLEAWAELKRRLQVTAESEAHLETNELRVSQIENRSWTWTQWRDEVTDKSGKRARMSDLLRGKGFSRLA